jgi:hypothetical protein
MKKALKMKISQNLYKKIIDFYGKKMEKVVCSQKIDDSNFSTICHFPPEWKSRAYKEGKKIYDTKKKFTI